MPPTPMPAPGRRTALVRAFAGLAGGLAVTAASAAAQNGPPGGDPFAYCARVGTVDKPSRSFSPTPVPAMLEPYLRPAFGLKAGTPLPPTSAYWRCMDRAVWVCVVGANLPCDAKADVHETNAGAEAFCRQNPKAVFAPAYAAGHET